MELKCPWLVFGVFQIRDDETTQKAVEEAIKVGYRLIDTAQSYIEVLGITTIGGNQTLEKVSRNARSTSSSTPSVSRPA